MRIILVTLVLGLIATLPSRREVQTSGNLGYHRVSTLGRGPILTSPGDPMKPAWQLGIRGYLADHLRPFARSRSINGCAVYG